MTLDTVRRRAAAVAARVGCHPVVAGRRQRRHPEAVVRLGYSPARIDLLTAIDGVRFNECHARRMRVLVNGVELPIIDLQDFRANKRASGRAKDLADLESLDDPP